MSDSTLPVATSQGLSLDRRNTKPGVDPYSQFEWSTRDVVMRNWRDGSVNFSQLGVEFPAHWSDNAVSIVTSKYFRGALNTASRETSLKQVIDRVVDVYRAAGLAGGYFNSEETADLFAAEMRYALVDQQFSFNSPVWFNVGTASKPQISACFILAVEDSMEGILDWYKEEGLIFKGGSGAGVNLSHIRSARELLSSGGNASGPVSFMRGADASAGTIKSGGATRRAAKMVILDVDHPDIRQFVETKRKEERKIRVLRDAGFDMDLGGEDSVSVQYQNANNSVRVTEEFMRAVEMDGEFALTARTDGSVIELLNARELFREIAEAAWECADPGIQYDGSIQSWHTLPNTGRISATNPCSEFVHLDNSSCNLASARLTKFYNPSTGVFDIEGFQYLVRLMMIAAEISVSFGHFPTEKIADVTRRCRPIGLGYTDLGALLMSIGVGYDSDEGRAWAAGITSLLAAEAYRTSAELAGIVGAFELFADNREAMLGVIGRHADASATAHGDAALHTSQDASLVALHAASTRTWGDAVELGEMFGYRNSQAVVIAPTGTISFFMDSQTTGIEPDLGLVKFKKISDGSSVSIINNLVPVALRSLGYDETRVADIVDHVLLHGSVIGAPGFDPTHASVFACAMGDNVVSAMGHLRMMAAVQPFVSGAISKTVNLPEDATVEDISEIYFQGWKMGLKCVAVYRDNCKVGQPLSVVTSATKEADAAAQAASGGNSVEQVAVTQPAPVKTPATASSAAKPTPQRVRLDRQRHAITTSYAVGGADGYMSAGTYADGQLGELFLKMSKPGSTLAGVMDAFAIAVSIGLQYGVPLETFVEKFTNTRFEPAGMTNDPDIRIATSVLDYMFRRLAIDHLPVEVRESLGILTSAERTAALSDSYGNAHSVVEDAAESAAVTSAEVSNAAPQATPVVVSAPVQVSLEPKPVASPISTVKSAAGDAPMCFSCGVTMNRAGSCHVCPSCGSTSGCS